MADQINPSQAQAAPIDRMARGNTTSNSPVLEPAHMDRPPFTALNQVVERQPSPLCVKSRHVQCKTACLL